MYFLPLLIMFSGTAMSDVKYDPFVETRSSYEDHKSLIINSSKTTVSHIENKDFGSRYSKYRGESSMIYGNSGLNGGIAIDQKKHIPVSIGDTFKKRKNDYGNNHTKKTISKNKKASSVQEQNSTKNIKGGGIVSFYE